MTTIPLKYIKYLIKIKHTELNQKKVENFNFISIVNFTISERLNSCCNNEEIKVVTFEEFEDEDLKTIDIAC